MEAVELGRNSFENIRKFMQFQITILLNLTIYTLGSLIKYKSLPVSAPIILWLNMVNYVVPAILFGSDLPQKILNNDKNRLDFREEYKMFEKTDNCDSMGNSILHNTEPFNPSEHSLITSQMIFNIFWSTVY